MLHTQTKKRSSKAAEGKFVGLVAKIKRMIARLFPTRGEMRQKELVLAERRRQDLIALRQRLRHDIKHRLDSRDYWLFTERTHARSDLHWLNDHFLPTLARLRERM